MLEPVEDFNGTEIISMGILAILLARYDAVEYCIS